MSSCHIGSKKRIILSFRRRNFDDRIHSLEECRRAAPGKDFGSLQKNCVNNKQLMNRTIKQSSCENQPFHINLEKDNFNFDSLTTNCIEKQQSKKLFNQT